MPWSLFFECWVLSFFTLLFHLHQEARQFLFAFCRKGDVTSIPLPHPLVWNWSCFLHIHLSPNMFPHLLFYNDPSVCCAFISYILIQFFCSIFLCPLLHPTSFPLLLPTLLLINMLNSQRKYILSPGLSWSPVFSATGLLERNISSCSCCAPQVEGIPLARPHHPLRLSPAGARA